MNAPRSSVPRLEAALGRRSPSERLDALRELAELVRRGALEAPPAGRDVNNHIHTVYSFSPYSPAAAVWFARKAGLQTAGIMDHDSLAGAAEFTEAGGLTGLATTVGLECRCDFSATRLAGRRINNPDQLSNAYIALHGVPHTRVGAVDAYFGPLRNERNRRNRRMLQRLNELLPDPDLRLGFDTDVVPLSMRAQGGTITERHLLFALAGKLVQRLGRGAALLDYLRREMYLEPAGKVREYLLQEDNPHYLYDLLGVLKSELVERFYIEAGAECPDVREVLDLCRANGVIAAYAYLGDVGESVTGDKRAQSFEDGYLEELFATIAELGFQAVTYMPPRNSREQLLRARELCQRYGLLQISGVDINSPRQSFLCPELRRPEFRHLVDATWALIGHEIEATRDIEAGMFSERSRRSVPALADRLRRFRDIALAARSSP